MLDVLATSAVLFMMLSTLPSTSIVSCWARAKLTLHNMSNGTQPHEIPSSRYSFIHVNMSQLCTEHGSTHLREITQHFRHFISTLSAADIDNHVTVGVLGQRLGDHSFSTSEGSRYSSGAALHATIEHRSLSDFPSDHR